MNFHIFSFYPCAIDNKSNKTQDLPILVFLVVGILYESNLLTQTPQVVNWVLTVVTMYRYGFKQQFPPGMRLTKIFRSKLKEWQCLPYVGPYEPFDGGVRRSREGLKRMEKRAVGIVHEFLSLTVEKMADVEQVSQFRKWFGIDLNIRDLFLDHPGIFYVSTKGKRHTVFLREAYEKGRLVEPNPIYDSRMKLLELVAMRRRGAIAANAKDASVVGERNGAMEDEAREEDDDEEYS